MARQRRGGRDREDLCDLHIVERCPPILTPRGQPSEERRRILEKEAWACHRRQRWYCHWWGRGTTSWCPGCGVRSGSTPSGASATVRGRGAVLVCHSPRSSARGRSHGRCCAVPPRR